MSDRDEANGRLHELDLYAWSKSTELLLIDRQIREVDWDAVAAELENSAEVNDAKPLREAVEKLLTHLTIWNVSADYHTRDRRSEIESARFKLDDTLSRSPSLARLMELEWKSLCRRAGLDARLILGESAALRELPTSELVLVTTDDREAESEFGALTRLRLRIARNPDDEADDSDEDHYAWCRAQAAAARSRHFDELDPIGIGEEISSVGTSVRRSCDRIIGGTAGQVDGMAGGTPKREPEEKDRVGPRMRTCAASEESKSRRCTGAAERSPQIHDERGRMGIRARADVIAIVSLEAGPSHRRRVYY